MRFRAGKRSFISLSNFDACILMCHYTSNKVRTGADRIGVTRRVAARRVARMSQLRYQAYCLSMSVFARIGPTVDRGTAGWACNVNRNVDLAGYYTLSPLADPPSPSAPSGMVPSAPVLPLRTLRSRSGATAARPRSRTSCNQNYVRADHVIRGSPHVAGRFTRM